jgi:hypothetical protein
MDDHCVVGGRFGLAAAMRSQVKPPWCDGLFAAGALRVCDHCFLPSQPLTISVIILRLSGSHGPSFDNIGCPVAFFGTLPGGRPMRAASSSGQR